MDDELNYAMAPLNTVDLKSLHRVSDSLKKSKNRNERAIGVFLGRLAVYREKGPEKRPQEKQTTKVTDDHGLSHLY
jgi:hypothetical protein